MHTKGCIAPPLLISMRYHRYYNGAMHTYAPSPGVVRTPSMSTFDSMELGRYSDDGKEVDEQVAGK